MSDYLLALALANPFSVYAHPDPISESEREAQEAMANRNRTKPTPPANGETDMSTQTHTNAPAGSTGNGPHPRTIGELWPSKWLKPEDLKRPATVIVAGVDWPEVYNPNTRQKEVKAAIRFAFRKADGTTIELDKRLIVNRTQAVAIAEIAGTDVLDGWTGTAVTLAAGSAHTGAATIVIGPAPKSANGNGGHPGGDDHGEV